MNQIIFEPIDLQKIRVICSSHEPLIAFGGKMVAGCFKGKLNQEINRIQVKSNQKRKINLWWRWRRYMGAPGIRKNVYLCFDCLLSSIIHCENCKTWKPVVGGQLKTLNCENHITPMYGEINQLENSPLFLSLFIIFPPRNTM